MAANTTPSAAGTGPAASPQGPGRSASDGPVTGRRIEGFPVGYYDDLHPDVSVNYNMNRFSTGEADMMAEMRAIGPRIHDYKDYTRELLALGEAALGRGEKLNGAYYLRSAEFYMFADDPRKQDTRRRFLQLIREHYGYADTGHFDVPYETGALSAYRPAPLPSPGERSSGSAASTTTSRNCSRCSSTSPRPGTTSSSSTGPGRACPSKTTGWP